MCICLFFYGTPKTARHATMLRVMQHLRWNVHLFATQIIPVQLDQISACTHQQLFLNLHPHSTHVKWYGFPLLGRQASVRLTACNLHRTPQIRHTITGQAAVRDPRAHAQGKRSAVTASRRRAKLANTQTVFSGDLEHSLKGHNEFFAVLWDKKNVNQTSEQVDATKRKHENIVSYTCTASPKENWYACPNSVKHASKDNSADELSLSHLCTL